MTTLAALDPQTRRSGRAWVVLVPNLLLGVVVAVAPQVATLHAIVILGALMWFALTSNQLGRILEVLAYAVGAQVFWRMVGAPLPWMTVSYATAIVLALVLVRFRLSCARVPLTLIYGVLLLPSALRTVTALPLNEARTALVFNLIGPAVVVLAAAVFSNLEADVDTVMRLVVALVAPICATGSLVSYEIVKSLDVLVFSNDSNSQTSGGFGANQVSSVLGLGVTCCAVLLVSRRLVVIDRFLTAGLLIWMFTLGVLTFSRGGVLSGIAAAFVAFLTQVNSSRQRERLILWFVMLVATLVWLVIPWLFGFTGGTAKDRFTSVDPTQRASISSQELQSFIDHPFAGIGPGMGRYQRGALGVDPQPSHTEFTRMLGEHGLMGSIAAVCFLVQCILWIKRRSRGLGGIWAPTWVTWAMTSTVHSAFRTTAVSLLLGWAALVVVERLSGRPPSILFRGHIGRVG